MVVVLVHESIRAARVCANRIGTRSGKRHGVIAVRAGVRARDGYRVSQVVEDIEVDADNTVAVGGVGDTARDLLGTYGVRKHQRYGKAYEPHSVQ